jgi:6-phosphofructokinase 1
VFSGGFIPKNHFYTPGKTITADNGQIYIKAGPRYHVALDNEKVKACIVTCGGLCPGLNVVIRELVMSLRYNYGVQDIFGIKWGYAGFYDDECWVRLTPDDVKEIHTQGGTVLGTSRGGFDGPKIAAEMLKRKINMGFFIGGDGTHRGIKELSKIFRQKKEKIILVGIPKTIDNDIPIIDRSFGLDTAVAESVRVIRAADVEANCNPNGIGLVKLFGRHSGYVAMYAALAARDVNICLIPEVPFNLYGENGLLDYIFKRIEIKHHAVIVVGEGAGYAVKDYDVQYSGKTDASGNPVLPDIGVLLKKEINKRGQELGIEINLKYIDPTYIIRAGPANSYDCNLCSQLAQNAVHCAFAGYTNFSIGIINNHSAMIPIDKISRPGVTRKIELGDDDYLMMLASTGQPSFFASEDCTSNVSASVNKPKDEGKDKQSETTKQQPIEIPKTLPIEDTKHDTTEQTLPSHSESEGEHKDELRFDEE